MPGPAVLVVDDEPSTLRALQRLLRREPYRLLTTGRPAEALRWAEEDDVRVALCDHRMPGMPGLELLREIRRRSPRTVCLLFTACTEPEIVKAPDVDGVVAKPWDDKALKEMILARVAPAPPPSPPTSR